jgi:MFS family permease
MQSFVDTARVQPAPRRLTSPLPLVGFVVFAVAMASFARVPLLPDIGRELRLSAAEIGMLTTAFALGRLAMDLPAGRVADGLPPGRALAGSGLAVLAGGALLAAAASPAAAVGGMVGLGLASALTNTTAMTAFATGAPAHRRGTAMAGFTTALMSGQALGPAVAGALAGLAA